jgi:hypothetical protein
MAETRNKHVLKKKNAGEELEMVAIDNWYVLDKIKSN